MNKEVEKFSNFAQQKWNALEEGDSKSANAYYDKLTQIADYLYKNGNIGELEVLLSDSYESSVRLEASCKLLVVSNSLAITTLNNLKSIRGMVGFTAKMTLKEWEKGNLS